MISDAICKYLPNVRGRVEVADRNKKMVPSLLLLSFESSMTYKKTLMEMEKRIVLKYLAKVSGQYLR